MMSRKSSKVAPLSLVAVALLLAPADADAGQYANLCIAAGKACVYTGPEAPTLAAEVCWNRVDVRIKGASDCPDGSWPYWLDHGEVIDPMLGLVIAYAPLPDACDLGLCVSGPSLGTTEGEALCCDDVNDTNDCTPLAPGCEGDVVWCAEASTNMNGGVDCHLTES